MGVLDFLFEGKPPPSTTTYGQTVESLPKWLSDYTQGLIAKANAVAADPYQAYGGPRVAGFTPDQQNAYSLTRSNVGNWQPTFNNASSYAQQGATINPLQAANGYFGMGVNQTIQGADPNNSGLKAAMPYLQQGSTYTDSGLDPSMSGTNAAAPYMGASFGATAGAIAPGQGGLSAAAPYLQGASQTFPGSVSQYMNPYIDNVVNRSTDQALRAWNEKIMPGLSDTFTSNGQYGSTRMADQVGKAARDVTDQIQQNAEAAYAGAYNNAGQMFGQDASRLAGLAGTAGQLGQGQQAAELQAGQQFGNIGQNMGALQQAYQQALLQGGQQYGQFGQLAGNLGSAQQQAQLQAGQQLGQFGTSAGNLYGQAGQLAINGSQQMGNLAQALQAMGIKDAASLEAIGSAQQGLTQQNLNTAYGDFQNQVNYPRQTLDWMSSIIRGLQQPTSTQTSTTGPGQIFQPSPLAQLATLGTLGTGLQQINGGQG